MDPPRRFVSLRLGRLTLVLLLTWRFPPGWQALFVCRRPLVLRLGWIVATWRGR